MHSFAPLLIYAHISLKKNQPTNQHSQQYGPYLPGFKRVQYNDVSSLEQVLNEFGPRIAGFLVEPIQGEAGFVAFLPYKFPK